MTNPVNTVPLPELDTLDQSTTVIEPIKIEITDLAVPSITDNVIPPVTLELPTLVLGGNND